MENFNKIINFVLIIIINLFYIKKSPIYKFIKLLKIIIIHLCYIKKIKYMNLENHHMNKNE
jgi:hypothetical protein